MPNELRCIVFSASLRVKKGRMKACEEDNHSNLGKMKMDELFKKVMRPFNGTWDAVESDMAVFENILLRLPVKSLLAFKSISKLWHGVISTKQFMILHHFCSKKRPKYFIFCDADELEDGIVREMYQMEPNGVYGQSYFIPDFESIYNPLLISSFNGLICCLNDVSVSLSSYEGDLRICNPATREVLLLPRGQSSVYMPTYGLAYSNSFHFYKIYKFFGEPIDFEEGNSQCEVYSSKTGVWKRLGRVEMCPLMHPWRPLYANHVCVNEKLYWFIADEEEYDIPASILMVDMDDNFKEIELPTEPLVAFLIEFRRRLCFLGWSGFKMFIFVYDEKKDSWQMVGMPIFPVKWMETIRFDSVVSCGYEILFVYRDSLGLRHELLYEVRRGKWKYFRTAERSKRKPLAVFPFFETLLPCGNPIR